MLTWGKIGHVHRRCIHMWMCQNNELTASEIQKKLRNMFGFGVSLSTINTVRRNLGWTSNTGKYCQQISHVNKRVSTLVVILLFPHAHVSIYTFDFQQIF